MHYFLEITDFLNSHRRFLARHTSMQRMTHPSVIVWGEKLAKPVERNSAVLMLLFFYNLIINHPHHCLWITQTKINAWSMQARGQGPYVIHTDNITYVNLQRITMLSGENSLFGVLLLPLLPRLECQNCQKKTVSNYSTIAYSRLMSINWLSINRTDIIHRRE